MSSDHQLETGARLPFLEVRAAASGEIAGYGSVFGVRDLHGDVIVAGAFADSLKRRAPAMLWSHDQSAPIGKWTEAVEDARGLRLRGKVNLATTRGREAFESLKAGDVTGLSVGFSIAGGGATYDDAGRRELRKVELFEVSIVAMPSNEAARVSEVRALGGAVELERLLAGFSNVPRRIAQRAARDLWAEIAGTTPEAVEAEERAARDAALMAEFAREVRAVAERLQR